MGTTFSEGMQVHKATMCDDVKGLRLTGLERELLGCFREAGIVPPEWAWPHPPAIPLVGRQYRRGYGLLIYASAENLAWQHPSNPDPHGHRKARAGFFNGASAWVRYQGQRQDEKLQAGRFFPDVGIQPISDGGLLCAAWFVASHLGLPAPGRPSLLLEQIALTNWSKFVIRSKANIDTSRRLARLRYSLPLIVSELAVLRPRIVMLPKSLLDFRGLRTAMEAASPGTRLLGLYQFSPQVINATLAPLECAGDGLRRRHEATPLREWADHGLGRVTPAAGWRYIAHVEKRLAEEGLRQGMFGR